MGRDDPCGAAKRQNLTSLVPPARTRSANHHRFDWSALFAEVAVNLEIDMERMRLDLRQRGFDAANRTRIFRLQLQRYALDTHVLSLPAGCLGAAANRQKGLLERCAEPQVFGALVDFKRFAPSCAASLTLLV